MLISFLMLFLCVVVPSIILVGFFFLSKKFSSEESQLSSFECGFYSYFYSRFGFSIQYFLVGMVFLFLDLELCVIFPFFIAPSTSGALMASLLTMVAVLLGGLIMEWRSGKLDWLS